MRYRLAALSLFLSFSLFGGAPAACPPDTPILRVDGRVIDYSYFSFVKSRIPQWAIKKYYSGPEGNKKLLDKILERQLILKYYEDSGFFKKPEIRNHLVRFKVKELASLYLSGHLKSPKVTESEVQEAIRKYYHGKKVTPEIRRSVRINLEAQKLASERESIVSSATKGLKVQNLNPKSPDDVVAVYGTRRITYRELEPLIEGKPTPLKLKRALNTYVLYLKALEEGLDRSREFKNSLLSFKENLAVSAFERSVLARVKVSDREVKEYYEKHKGEFKTPASAEVLIFVFPSESEAKKALKLLKAGKSLKEAVPPSIYSTGRRWTVLSNDRNNPVAMLVFSSKEKYNLLNMPDGRTLLVVVEKRIPSRQKLLGDVYREIKEELTARKARRLVREELSTLKKRYSPQVLPSFLNCAGKEESN